MVLQIFADPRQRVVHRDADAAEMLGVADPDICSTCGEPIGAAAEDHLARRIDPLDRARRASIRPPTARLPSSTMRCTSAPVTTCRLGRFSAGRR